MPQKYIKKGHLKAHYWYSGGEFKKGCIPWIKGKKGIFKQSEEFKKYMHKRMSGISNPMFGMVKDKCPAWKGKKIYCMDCKKEITKQATRCSHCAKIGLNILEKNGRWQGGKSFEIYPVVFNQQLKERIRVRDNFICQLCGVPELENKRRLSVHHIDYDKKNCENKNLISLCNKCNANVNQDKEFWIIYFNNLMEKKNESHIWTGIC